MYKNEKENIANSEMVRSLIKEYFNIPDEKPRPDLKEIFERNIPKEDRIIPTPEQLLEESLKDFKEFENNLEEITSLSCILDDPNVRFRSEEAYEKYVNYLLIKAPDILLHASSLLRWLYNERKYGTPAPNRKKK